MGAWIGDRFSIGIACPQSVNSMPKAAVGAIATKARIVTMCEFGRRRCLQVQRMSGLKDWH